MSMRVLIQGNPFAAEGIEWAWITCPDAGQPPYVTAYRRVFTLDEAATVRVHVSADERYELFLDGRRVGRGPERGDAANWYVETYDLPLGPGAHTLVAHVWALGDLAPMAQMTSAPGFVLLAEPPHGDLLSTGVAPWEGQRLEGYHFVRATEDDWYPWFTGPNGVIDAARFPWGIEEGKGDGWAPVAPRRRGEGTDPFGSPSLHALVPATLPAQVNEPLRAGRVRFVAGLAPGDPSAIMIRMTDHRPDDAQRWQELIDDRAPLDVPPRTRRRVILDLGMYYCAYPRLVASGGRGGSISLRWAEALFADPDGRGKGQRDSIEDMYFRGMSGDTLLLDGGPECALESLWWRAGRYLELVVETADDPLTVQELSLRETRYPFEQESRFASNDARIERMIPIAWRGLQMCAHETYMDCPYYEQLMYAGDTRLQALVTYAMTRDDRLPRKALAMFDASRLPGGLTQSRYPSRQAQVIPPFSLWWIGMVHDYARWRGDRERVAGLLPGVRGVLDAFLHRRNDDGLIEALSGWNFVDWVPAWPRGIPPDAERGVNAAVNWQCVLALDMAAELEDWAGEPELAARDRRHAQALAGRVVEMFWDEQRGLLADDPAKGHFSEHTQCLALLSGHLDGERRERIAAGLLGDRDLARTTIYFTHYLFEAYRLLGRMDALFERLGLWFELAPQGFATTPEMSDLATTRSDCHAWGAHPTYHLFASVLGIRPAAFGFDTVEIAPQLGPLSEGHGSLVHPRGKIEVELRRTDDGLTGTITLPDGVEGTLRYGDTVRTLAAGRQEIGIP